MWSWQHLRGGGGHGSDLSGGRKAVQLVQGVLAAVHLCTNPQFPHHYQMSCTLSESGLTTDGVDAPLLANICPVHGELLTAVLPTAGAKACSGP